MTDRDRLIREAKAAREADIARLAEMTPQQLRYLRLADELEDPESDGMGFDEADC